MPRKPKPGFRPVSRPQEPKDASSRFSTAEDSDANPPALKASDRTRVDLPNPDKESADKMSASQNSYSPQIASTKFLTRARLLTYVLAAIYIGWLVFLAWVSYMVLSA